MSTSRHITGKTKVIAILGHPVEHSLSPVMQNAEFERLGLDYVYVPAAVSPGAVAASAGTEAWQALGQSMQKIVRSGLIMQQQRDHDLLVDAQNRYTNAMTAFSTEAETSRAGEKARGFTRDFTGRSGETRETVSGKPAPKPLQARTAGALLLLVALGVPGELAIAGSNCPSNANTAGSSRLSMAAPCLPKMLALAAV